MHLGSLSIDQLQQLRNASQQEIEYLSHSLAQLQTAVERLQNSKKCAGEYADVSEGNDILVPMTSSVYVPGVIAKNEMVLVDLGTGYYCEKTPAQAEEYFARRIKTVKEQIEKANHVLSQKKQQTEAISMVLQRKSQMVGQAS